MILGALNTTAVNVCRLLHQTYYYYHTYYATIIQCGDVSTFFASRILLCYVILIAKP